MKKLLKKEWMIIILFIFTFIAIRSINFQHHLNFSSDQASSSMRIYDLWEKKELTLIGPSISFKYIGRELFTSSISYYYQLFFLLISNFSPIVGSYVFMIFSAFMLFPLYYGVKFLINKPAAIILLIIYTLLPYYIDYTRFFWNPNFQLTLTPILIFFIGIYNKKNKNTHLFLLAFTAGLLMLFHYQYAVIVIGLLLFYILIKKIRINKILIFFAGFILGFLPLIVFEIRNNFYNFQTLSLYIKNIDKVFSTGNNIFSSHYFLSIYLFVLITVINLVKKHITNKRIFYLITVLLIIDLFIYARIPKHAFGMTDNWNYLYEEKVYKIIRNENITNYNIVNLEYDTVAAVQKYLHKKDKIKFNYEDYYNNKYLFVISKDDNFMQNPAYEINTFKPSRVVKNWNINNIYKLYLLKRLN
jgi:hypothetical protein